MTTAAKPKGTVLILATGERIETTFLPDQIRSLTRPGSSLRLVSRIGTVRTIHRKEISKTLPIY